MSNTVLSASPVFIYVINLLLTGTDTEISGMFSASYNHAAVSLTSVQYTN